MREALGVAKSALLCCALSGIAAGCSTSTDPEDIFGRYTLDSIGAESLPREVFDGTDVFSVHSGHITLNDDETCSATFRISMDGGSQSDDVRVCTFSLVAQTIFVTWEDGTSSPGLVDNNEVGLTLHTRIFLFKK